MVAERAVKMRMLDKRCSPVARQRARSMGSRSIGRPRRYIHTGQVFGKWTVIGESDKSNRAREIYWRCVCVCGLIKPVNGLALLSNRSRSCKPCSKRKHKTKSIGYKLLRDKLSDSYIKHCLTKHNPILSAKDIPKTLIKVKREHLRINRYLKENENSQT